MKDLKEHLFSTSKWLGEGRLILNELDEDHSFYMRWRPLSICDKENKIEAVQEIQSEDSADVMINKFTFYHTGGPKNTFLIEVVNDIFGRIEGKGYVKDNFIGWEFKDTATGIEGFECYIKQAKEQYYIESEMLSFDECRTSLKGKIWKQKE